MSEPLPNLGVNVDEIVGAAVIYLGQAVAVAVAGYAVFVAIKKGLMWVHMALDSSSIYDSATNEMMFSDGTDFLESGIRGEYYEKETGSTYSRRADGQVYRFDTDKETGEQTGHVWTWTGQEGEWLQESSNFDDVVLAGQTYWGDEIIDDPAYYAWLQDQDNYAKASSSIPY